MNKEQSVLEKLEKELETQYESWEFDRMQPTKTFILERSKQWSEILGIPYYEIIDKWLDMCNYSMINYFQNANQPKLSKDTHIFETMEDFKNSVGDKGFRCPYCKGVSSDLWNCNSGVKLKLINRKGKEKCNWTAGGFLGTMGKGVFVFIKETFAYGTIFMPIAWEKEENGNLC